MTRDIVELIFIAKSSINPELLEAIDIWDFIQHSILSNDFTIHYFGMVYSEGELI